MFPNLEKCRAANNTINRLVKRYGEIMIDDSEVIEEIKNYHEESYKEDN